MVKRLKVIAYMCEECCKIYLIKEAAKECQNSHKPSSTKQEEKC